MSQFVNGVVRKTIRYMDHSIYMSFADLATYLEDRKLYYKKPINTFFGTYQRPPITIMDQSPFAAAIQTY